ncbi:MAG TPA: hypothetical protein VHB77_07365 [Planctomycetaceae bacterium]|nr:hypothetical protein [Planctomycetaceae bacterium]
MDESFTGELRVVRSADGCELICEFARLRFALCDGRWLQTLDVRATSDAWATLGEQMQPAGPAFQDLHVETLGPGCVEVQAMGQASRNVYSCAVRFDAQRRTIDFDFAARLRTVTAESVASVYLLQSAPEPQIRFTEQQMLLGAGVEPILLMTCLETDTALNVASGDRHGEYRVRAAYTGWTSLDPGRTGVTARWRYQIAFAP